MKLFRRDLLKTLATVPFLGSVAASLLRKAPSSTQDPMPSTDIKTEPFIYEGPGGPFEGTVSWARSQSGKRPAVIVSHAFGGQGPFDTDKAEELARMGYVGIAIDVYGQGVRASGPDEAYKLMGAMNEDRALLRERLLAALEAVQRHELVDENNIAAIGFCFGGKCVLDLARSGADIKGVVSFHGVYDAPRDLPEPAIRAKVLVLHGWDDPLAKPSEVKALANEFTRRGADWQLHAFGNTGHSFTNPRAQAPEQGMAYNALSDRRAWAHLSRFLSELFGDAGTGV